MHAGASTMRVMTNHPPRTALDTAVPAMAELDAVRLPIGESEVCVWRVPLRARSDALARLIELLPADERSRMDAIQDDANRRRFAVAHGALRLLLAHHLREQPDRLAFAIGAHGKP